MKRVANLYRVSTKGQVDIVKDDIPMQRIACRAFAEERGWTVVIEKEEKGISGFKVSAEKRDAIQELKEAASKKEFDVLLVFMFDRLGRIENETPFILQWFTEHDIEVWSVNEGQQRMENHVDKLMNYIRFWQASGESEKTAIRVKTRLHQMTSEGLYTGGVVPLGYEMVDKGRLNKKGKPVRDLVINPAMAEIVRTLFSKVINEGFGSHQLATYLNSLGLRTVNNALYKSSNVLRLLRNELYRGFFVRGDVRSERNEELQIISDIDFLKVQEILEMRSGKSEEKRTVAMNNRGKALLTGVLFCAHCGHRLTGSRHIESFKRKDGTVTRKEHGTYVCYHNSRKLSECDGPTTYMSDRVDRIVLDAMRYIFANIAGCPEEEKIQEAYRRSVECTFIEQKKLEAEIQKDTNKLEVLRAEIAKAIIGDSIYSSEDLSTAINLIKKKIKDSEQRLEELRNKQASEREKTESIIPAYRQFRTWASEFEDSTLEAKKMIVSQLFSKIEVGRNYSVRFYMNFTYKQFCEDWMTLDKKINATV